MAPVRLVLQQALRLALQQALRRGASKRPSFDPAMTLLQAPMSNRRRVPVSSDVIFVGHGIQSPEYTWDDYKGIDVRGKIVMIMVNEPPATSIEPNLFGATALTYYGRWTYKFEEAARRGALGVILIHTNATAGYGWNVVTKLVER